MPRQVVLSKVRRSLKDPKVRPWRICKLDEDISHVEELAKIKGNIDFIELQAAGERRTLPPTFGSINGIGGWMRFVAPCFANITILTLDGLAGVTRYRSADQFAV